MKTKLMLILTASLVLTACQSPTTPPTAEQREAQIAKVAATVEGLASAGTSLYLSKNQGSESYLLAAAGIIEASANAGVLNPAEVQAALVKQLPGEEAKAAAVALTTAFGLYQAFVGANVDATLDTSPAFKSALLALARGVRGGVQPVSASADRAPLRIPDDLILR